jgi:hypothetical protein
LLCWYKSTRGKGTQFTCFAGTKVQTLTPGELLQAGRFACRV